MALLGSCSIDLSGVLLEGSVKPQAPPHCFLLPGHEMSTFTLPCAPAVMSCHRAKAMWPVRHGLESPKLQAKVDLFSLLTHYFCHFIMVNGKLTNA